MKLFSVFKQMSLTDIAFISILIKVVAFPSASIVDGILFAFAVGNYMHKRYENNKAALVQHELDKQTNLEKQVQALQDKLANVEQLKEQIQAQSDEVQKIVRNANLMSLVPHRK